MYLYSPRPVHVRPEMDRMAEYRPGESQEAFSARTGIPIEQLIKLNSNESPYGPAPQVLQRLGWIIQLQQLSRYRLTSA